MVDKVKVGNEIFNINTSYKIAIRCSKIALDEDISDTERSMAIIFLLFGKKGLENTEIHGELLRLGILYLNRGETPKKGNSEPNMDYSQDEPYIYASFRNEYQINLEIEDMHWWRFMDLLNGLTENSILNRVRAIRDYDISDVAPKDRQKIIEAKESVKLEKKLSKKKQEALDKINRLIKKG